MADARRSGARPQLQRCFQVPPNQPSHDACVDNSVPACLSGRSTEAEQPLQPYVAAAPRAAVCSLKAPHTGVVSSQACRIQTHSQTVPRAAVCSLTACEAACELHMLSGSVSGSGALSEDATLLLLLWCACIRQLSIVLEHNASLHDDMTPIVWAGLEDAGCSPHHAGTCCQGLSAAPAAHPGRPAQRPHRAAPPGRSCPCMQPAHNGLGYNAGCAHGGCAVCQDAADQLETALIACWELSLEIVRRSSSAGFRPAFRVAA